MATYKEILKWIKAQYGCSVKTCWIAHAKEICNLPVRNAFNRISLNERKYPCPDDKFFMIEAAFYHFKMLDPYA